MFTDALIMDKTWEVPGGFLGFSARFARTGVQMYDGSEIDPEGTFKDAAGARRFVPGTLYPVDRPAEEVFKPSAMASFIAKPLTNDHPADGVSIDDWNAKTKGVIGEVLRDGEFARLSGLMTDKGLIADFRAGKKDLSGGYEATLVVRDGVNPAGEAYVAQQTNIGGNHVAFVKHGRAGNTRVADAAPSIALPQSFLDSLKPQEKPVKTMLIDGLTVDISNADTALATINTILAARDAALGKVTALDTEIATLKTEATTKDAKIATLEQSVKDAKPTPAQLRDAGKALMLAAGKAKALGVTVTDEMDEPAIMAATVKAKMGDAAKNWNDAQIGASFAVLTKDTKIEATQAPISGSPLNFGDAQTEYQDAQAKRKQELRDAWKTPANSNAVAA